VIPTHARIWPASALDRRVMARNAIRDVIAQRDATVAGSAGYLVQTENLGFIELLRNRTVAFAMGATRLSGLVGNVTIPKQTVGATAYWLASETTSITEGNQTFVQVSLTPNTVGAYTQIPRLLQLQSSPAALQIISNDLAQQVAVAADAAIINGGAPTSRPASSVPRASEVSAGRVWA
jgi:HK97 family phage major capsid protein